MGSLRMPGTIRPIMDGHDPEVIREGKHRLCTG
jgi:hypothetical protein